MPATAASQSRQTQEPHPTVAYAQHPKKFILAMLREIEEHNVNRGNKCNQPYDTIELQMIVFTAKK